MKLLIVILHCSPPSKKFQTNFPDYTKILKNKQTNKQVNKSMEASSSTYQQKLYPQTWLVGLLSFSFLHVVRSVSAVFLQQIRFRLLSGPNSHIARSDRWAGFSTCSCRLTDGKQRKQACCAKDVLFLFWSSGITNRSSRPRWPGAPAVCPAWCRSLEEKTLRKSE